MKKKDDKPKSVEEWVSKVDEKFKQGEDWTTKRQILINTNYYLSNQWIGWDAQNRRVVNIPRRNNEERITYNIIKPRVMTKLAKQTKNRIKYDVIPDTNDQKRIEIAKASTKFLHHWWQEENLDRKTRDIFLNNAVKAYCLAKVYFDPDEGDDITPTEEEVAEYGLEAGEQTRTGKVVCRICDPLTVSLDPAATTDDEIRWIVEEKPRDVDYIENKYGKTVTPDENINYLSQYDVTGLATNNDQEKKNKNMAMVRELWIAPCAEYPNGLKVTTTRNEFLDIDENAGELPYVIFGDIPIPGSIKYEAFIKDMLPIQREINIIRTMFATHAKKMGNSVWLLPVGSNVDEDSINNDEAAIIEYNAVNNGKPERVGPNDIPSFFDRILEYGNRDIDDMSGAREITQGRLPAGLDTASGLALMVEQENEKLAVSSQNYEYGMKKLLRRVLMLMKKHYTEERLGRILGADNEIELISFTGAELSGGEDINIIQGSSLPEMRSAQEERIMNLYNMGAIVRKDGSPDVDAFLRLMGMGDSTELYEQHQLDENKAKTENKLYQKMMEDQELYQMIMQYEQEKANVEIYNQTLEEEAVTQQLQLDPEDFKQPPTPPKGIPLVREFQDHEIHLYQHNVFRKSNEYEELPHEIQQMIDAHVAEHEQLLHGPMMQQEQEQMAMQQQKEAQEMSLKQEKLEIDKLNAMSKAQVAKRAD